jgi:three-Cys-motif partner protein
MKCSSLWELRGSAVEAAKEVAHSVNRYGLHFAFLDPYNLGELDFSIIQALSQLKRIDMLIHVSAMDLQRNLERNIASPGGAFDIFAPGWRGTVNLNSSQAEIRRQVFEYWRDQVAQLGTGTANDVRLITGEKNQRLYWLLLAAKHELARKFWGVAANVDKQRRLL